MLSRRLVGLVCVLTAASCVTIARAEEEEPTLDPSLARMYAASSADTLAAVARALEDAGLKIDARDEEAGLLRTKWKRYKAKRFPGLEIVPPRREWGQTEFEVQKIRVFVFVSQYVEPARVHITSRINFERFKPPQLVVRDHLPELSAWLFDRLGGEDRSDGSAS